MTIRLPSGHPASIITRGGDYRDPRNRVFSYTVDVDLLNLPSLPRRMDGHLRQALRWHLNDVAEAVISTAQQSLVPGHGYDTGLMHDTLVAQFAEHLAATGVFYDLLSEVAYYWRWVEFGHWTVGGNWWEGYHFLENAIMVNESRIRSAVREAWADTAVRLAGEARASRPPNMR